MHVANIHRFLRYLYFLVSTVAAEAQLSPMKFTKHTLKKLEDLFDELDYEILYGKGNFQSGYCLVENQNKVVINRYFEVEARINCLVDILNGLEVKEGQLSDKSAAFLKKILQINRSTEEPAATDTSPVEDTTTLAQKTE